MKKKLRQSVWKTWGLHLQSPILSLFQQMIGVSYKMCLHFNSKYCMVVTLKHVTGYDDVGYHNPQRKTPYMNWMAENGLRMEQSHVSPWCTPSRAAFLTGKYPHKIGQQVANCHAFCDIHLVCKRFNNQRNLITMWSLAGLNVDEKLLPQYLKHLGYETHLVGK